MNPNFQLNIDCYKINNWLEQRKKLPKDWQICLKACDAKIQTLIEDPILKQYKDVQAIIQNEKQNFTFSHVIQISQILQKSKLGTQKNFIGQYTNITLKGWLALKAYMKKNIVGLLHTARVINQVLKFDLPGSKKNKQSLNNQIVVLKRKIDSNNNAIYQNKINFANECKRYNIKGQNIREEVPKLIEQIPQWLNKVEKQCGQDIIQILDLYQTFCKVNGSQPPEMNLLRYFSLNKDDLVEVYLQKKPDNIQQLRLNKYNIFKQNANKQWLIQVAGEDKQNQNKHQTILSNRQTRLELLNNLNQVYCFYQILQTELKSGDTHLLSNDYLKIQPSQETISEYLSKLNKIISPLNNSHFNELIGLYEHPQSAQRICHKIELYPTSTKKFQEQSARLLSKIQEIKEAIINTDQQISKLKILIQKIKIIAQKQLSTLMKKEVRIVGDINKVEIEY